MRGSVKWKLKSLIDKNGIHNDDLINGIIQLDGSAVDK